MRPTPVSMIVLVGLLALGACKKSDDDKVFGDRVHAYLLNHPEVIQEVSAKLQAKEQDQAVAAAKAAIEKNRAALERDPSDFVANPNGKVTVTEFYDYRCPHCVNMAPTVLSIIQANPDVRFVFKEFPIFGAVSEEAAAGALMVKKNGGDYLGLYRDFMAAKGLDQGQIEQILKAHGVDPAALKQPANAELAETHFAAIKQLAVTLGIEGTPAFVVGDTLIPGEDIDGLHAAIAAAKRG